MLPAFCVPETHPLRHTILSKARPRINGIGVELAVVATVAAVFLTLSVQLLFGKPG